MNVLSVEGNKITTVMLNMMLIIIGLQFLYTKQIKYALNLNDYYIFTILLVLEKYLIINKVLSSLKLNVFRNSGIHLELSFIFD